MTLTELRSADAYCRHLTRRHYENFLVVSPFVSREIRRDLTRVYAFCRTTDDLGDESGSNGTIRLARWREEVEACFGGERPIHPVLIALRETVAKHGLPAGPFLDLIEANVQDQTVTQYEEWEELRRYCLLSAAPVGRMVLSVFGIGNSRAEALSDDVCVGLQLANHAQDVRRDAAIGRGYLLRQIVRSAGAVAAIRDLTDRAEHLLTSGRELERMVPFGLRAQLMLYRLGGQEVVRSIRALDYRTDRQRPHVSNLRKLILVARALSGSVSRVERMGPPRGVVRGE